ncbi:MAG: hypothetical protein GF330_12240, partial [Candidatus Eisenbacteria bacterium]|nr:hypothetical protein [Candidatus Eisenbacteria bacterium]
MRRSYLLAVPWRMLLVVGLFSGAMLCVGFGHASVDFLGGGTFICHHPPGLLYSQPPAEGWYEHFLGEYALTDPNQQNPRIETIEPVVWFVLSAFDEEKEWCGTEFGFGPYDPALFDFATWGACVPSGHLELPSENWPGPEEGVAVVVTDVPWYGQIVPVYYFAGYAAGLSGRIPLAADPLSGFIGWGNCLTPPDVVPSFCLPEMGVFDDGTRCYPDSVSEGVCCVGEECYVVSEWLCEQLYGEWHPEWPNCDGENVCLNLRVCCVGQDCSLTSDYECYLLGGQWHEDWTTCDPNPCPPDPQAACCVGDDCFILTEAECHDAGGSWAPWFPDCGPPNPCAIERVCCVGEECHVVTETECAEMGGTWHLQWHDCEPTNPCDQNPVRVCCLDEECLLTTLGECEDLEGIWHPHA